MTAPSAVISLREKDPSLSVALAALLRAADEGGAAEFNTLVPGFRHEFAASEGSMGQGGSPEVSGEAVRESLRLSVLPRLAIDGWIEDGQEDGWRVVRLAGDWWRAPEGGREALAAAMVDMAKAGWHRRDSLLRSGTSIRGSVLRGEGLCKSFKRRRVVDDVSVQLTQGEIVGLLGPNGAGKTTTFYLLTGLIRPDRGRVLIDDLELTTAPMYRRARKGLGYLAQEPSVFRKMTVAQNVMAILETMNLTREERHARLETMLDELAIKHLRDQKAYALSGGERRRLEITRALVTDPRFMLLDEPFAGVDPIAVHDIQTIVASLRHRGIGVLITDHNVEQTLDIVDRAYIMFEGKVQAAGTVRELVYNDEVAQVYLGPTLTARLRSRFEAVA
jgi:lipopolysaccharide export system ATP-binding protein